MSKNSVIRKIYLYLFSLIGLVLITIGSVRLVTLALKVYVLTKADQYYEYPAPQLVKPEIEGKEEVARPSQQQLEEFQKNQQTSQRQREAAGALAMIIIGVPLYIYHWRMIKKDQKENAAT